MNFVKHVKTKLCQSERRGGDTPIVIEADGKEAEEIVNALLHREGTGDTAKQQTVTIPLESYAQMLRSHAQMEMLRAAWDEGNAVRMMRAVFGCRKDGKCDAE